MKNGVLDLPIASLTVTVSRFDRTVHTPTHTHTEYEEYLNRTSGQKPRLFSKLYNGLGRSGVGFFYDVAHRTDSTNSFIRLLVTLNKLHAHM